ncbi:MAG: phosphoglycerate dehydrogenase [Spirochaetota bacterium]
MSGRANAGAPGGATNRGTVLVTPRSLSKAGHPALAMLEDAGFALRFGPPGEMPSEDDLRSLLPGCVGYLAGVEPIGAELIAACPELRVISRNGVGVDAVDLDAARRHGIEVLTSPGANSQGVAELAIGLMFAAARMIPAADASLKAGRWSRSRGVELVGRTLGVVGCGAIGMRVLASGAALGMEATGYDPFAREAVEAAGHTWLSLDALVGRAEVISLHAPPGERPLLDEAMLRRVRPGLIVVNTARAALVETDAMLAALDDGRVAAYATDAYAEEPPVDRRLVEHPHVIATPHVGGYTEESVERATRAAVENLLAALASRAAAPAVGHGAGGNA